MNANDPNVMLLETVAQHLGADLLESLVFVGGAVAGLLITDPAMPSIRPTEDVDLVVQATMLHEYHAVELALKAQGFVQDMLADAPHLPLAYRNDNGRCDGDGKNGVGFC